MAFPLVAALAGSQLLGGLLGSRSQARNRAQQMAMLRRAMQMAQRNYDERSPFRNAALGALNDHGRDWSGMYDPSLYTSEDLNFSPTNRGAAQSAIALKKVGNIDRTANIRQALKDFDAESAPAFEANARRIGQRASQFGALGKGTINTELGELGARIGRERNSLQNSLISNAEERSVDDAFREVDAAQRDESLGMQADDAEYRRRFTERDRRSGLRRQGFMDRVMLGEQDRTDDQQALARALGLGEFGWGNDPSGMMLGGAGQYGANAAQAGQSAGINWSALAQLLAQYFPGGGGAMAGTPSPYAGPNPGQYL